MHISCSSSVQLSKRRLKRPFKSRAADSFPTTGENPRMKMLRAATALALAACVICPAAAWAQSDAAHGESLFAQFCAGCHGKDGRGGAHTFMPHVDTLTKKGYIDQVPDETLAFIIAEGGAPAGKSGYMPAWKSKLSEKDIQDIIAHIRSLPTY
jgi:mono/diheme cytochrome c family protein